MSETLKVVVERTDGFDSIEDQLKKFVLESHKSNMEKSRSTDKRYSEIRTWDEFQHDLKYLNENEAFPAFKNGLKSWVKQKSKRGGAQELSKAMMVVESIVKLGLGKDKLEFFEFEEKGIYKGNNDEDNGNESGKCGDKNPQNGKRKPNNLEKKGQDKMFPL
ncbi:hypothetical protein PVK06_048773 [Gossypium arboreum]|uniref:Uncharacterized protein n=1 Tax=Gossypium arboreum TaxID=29729 RepID=A0ABR0MGS9_GOSAR|nr:hypothetical protein PVK06_048773 [Gossypium arboreum]